MRLTNEQTAAWSAATVKYEQLRAAMEDRNPNLSALAEIRSLAVDLTRAFDTLRQTSVMALRAEIDRLAAERAKEEVRNRNKFYRMKRQYGLDVEAMNGGWMIYPPAGLYPDERDDPHDGDHFADSAQQALEIAGTYAAVIDAKR